MKSQKKPHTENLSHRLKLIFDLHNVTQLAPEYIDYIQQEDQHI